MTERPGEAALDGWTWMHMASGAGLGVARLPWQAAAGLLVGFEVVEAGLRRVPAGNGGLFEHESARNVVADVITGLVGYGVGRMLRWGLSGRR